MTDLPKTQLEHPDRAEPSTAPRTSTPARCATSTSSPSGELLMVASDRISIFDFVLDTTIPDKGEILTRMSLWWFDQLADLVPNHVISTDVPDAGARPGGGLRAARRCTRSSAWPAAT